MTFSKMTTQPKNKKSKLSINTLNMPIVTNKPIMLSVTLLNGIMPSVTLPIGSMLSVTLPNGSMLSITYAKCHFSEWQYG
jgi:hypothetical protein